VLEGPLAFLRDLERADEEKGAALAELDGLATELDQIRAKTQALQAFATRLPAEREGRLAELDRARAEVAEADRVLAEAEAALRTAKPEAQRDAELFATRARDRAAIAERRAAEAVKAAEALETRAAEAMAQGEALGTQARELASVLDGRPRIAAGAGKEPGTGLQEVEAWAEVARAALFVARGQLAAEREAVIRQANEIGALALGEPLGAASVALVARRIETATD
jgi:chromosome segregation ATPase